jgi:hypothetical protein
VAKGTSAGQSNTARAACDKDTATGKEIRCEHTSNALERIHWVTFGDIEISHPLRVTEMAMTIIHRTVPKNQTETPMPLCGTDADFGARYTTGEKIQFCTHLAGEFG